MIKESLTVYDEKGNYFVIDNDVVKDCTFIVYMEGTPKAIMKLWLEHRHIMPGKRVFFCDSGSNKYFKNNCVEVEDGLFEYTGRR